MNKKLLAYFDYFNRIENVRHHKDDPYRSVVEHSPDLITRWNKDLKLVYANKAFEMIAGVSNETLYGKNNIEMGQPADVAMPWMERLQQVFQTGEAVKHFHSFSTPAGIIPFYTLILPERDADNKIVTALAIGRNISDIESGDVEREKTAIALKEEIHFIGQVMNMTPDIIYIMDLNTRQLIYSNRKVAADIGYTKEQIAAMNNPIFDIMYEEDIPMMNEHLKKMKTIKDDDKVVEVEYRLTNAAGGISWFCDRNSVFRRNASMIPVEKIGITQNITEKKMREEQILTNLDILAQAEEIAEMGSWEYDIQSRSFKWSEGMYRLFNLPLNKKVTPDVYFDYTPDEEFQIVAGIVNNIQTDFKSFEEIITLIPQGQEKKVVKIKAVIVKDKKKRPIKVIGVDRDITHEVKADMEINELNQILTTRNTDLEMLNKELKTFNSVASRDYKDTIQILYTNLEYVVAKEARILSDMSKANIRKAQAAIQKMKLLTEDINSYLRLYDVGINKSMIDSNAVVEGVLSNMRGKLEQCGATVEKAELPPLYADPLLFSQLLHNLIDNSIKFRKLMAQPLIKIKYSQADEMNAVPQARKDTPYTMISVSDNGIGFKNTEADQIFELFFRLHNKGIYKGSGIGLAICKKIMMMHNGFIIAESMPAAGATFTCYFPSKK